MNARRRTSILLAGAIVALMVIAVLRTSDAPPPAVTAPSPTERPLDVVHGEASARSARPADRPVEVDAAPEPAQDDVAEVVDSPRELFGASGVLVERVTRIPIGGVSLGFAFEGQFLDFAAETTDAAGSFRIRDVLPPGRYVVWAPNRWPILTPSGGSSRGFEVARFEIVDRDVTDVVAEFPWCGRLSGRVVDSSGAGIAGARVAPFPKLANPVNRRPGADGLAHFLAGDEGRFEIALLPTDREFEVQADATGFAAGRCPDAAATTGGGEVVIVLYHPGRLSIRVETANGEPLAGVKVVANAFDDAGAWLFVYEPHEQSDAEGRIEIGGLSPGRYSIGAGRPGTAFTQWVAATIEEGAAAEVTLRADPAHLLITGRVSRQGDGPLPGNLSVVARALFDDGSAGTYALMESDGTFTASVERPGRYALWAGTSRLDAGEPVEAAAGDSDVEVCWRAPATSIVIRPIDGDGDAPVELTEIRVGPAGGHAATFGGTTRDRREFKMAILPGSYDVFVAAPSRAPGRARVDVGAGEAEPHVVEVVLAPGRRVDGHVVSADGKPRAHAKVAVVSEERVNRTSVVETRDNGTFTIDAAPEDGGEVALVGERSRILARAPAASGVVLTVPAR